MKQVDAEEQTIRFWQEIYDANREVLRGENTLRPGQRLRIP